MPLFGIFTQLSTSLFRPESVASRGGRLHGDVMVSASLASWMVTGFAVAICSGAMAFAATATYARSELVPGTVTSMQSLAKAVAPRPGLVTAMLVEDGQRVRAGQVLARLRVEQASAAGDGVATISLQSLMTQRGLAMQRLSLERQRASAEQSRLAGQIRSASRQLAQLDRQIGLQDEMVASSRTAVDQAETLIAKGFATRTDLERRRQGWLQAAQARRQLAQNRDALQGQIAMAQAELARLPVDTASAIAQLQSNIAQLDMASAQQAGEQGYQVNAPISGRVTAVQTAVGRFADGRVPLLTIVPDGSAMRAELFAPSRAMGFVQPGQSVRVMYDAFPYQRFGSFPGRVEQLSRTVIAPGEVDAPVKIDTPVFRIRVTLPQQAVAAYGASAPLQPGMTLQANIVLERRSFLQWLLEPVMAVRNRT